MITLIGNPNFLSLSSSVDTHLLPLSTFVRRPLERRDHCAPITHASTGPRIIVLRSKKSPGAHTGLRPQMGFVVFLIVVNFDPVLPQ
uniref:Uncharacterized protein n=1 Tax=Cannabis sativa TaxID=3483 RepID=A0A803R9Q1_CANSA